MEGSMYTRGTPSTRKGRGYECPEGLTHKKGTPTQTDTKKILKGVEKGEGWAKRLSKAH